MDWNQVSAQLYDLPATYLRVGPNFTTWQNSLTVGLVQYTTAVDAILSQLDFANAQGNWLNVWGKAFDISRISTESDSTYKNRATLLLQSGRTTPAAIEQYVASGLGYVNTVSENFAEVEWSITFSSPVAANVIQEVVADLVYVRPAGVPFTANTPAGLGLYLGSINYLGAGSVTGAYLTSPSSTVPLGISVTTNQSAPSLPTTYLENTVLNPSLA